MVGDECGLRGFVGQPEGVIARTYRSRKLLKLPLLGVSSLLSDYDDCLMLLAQLLPQLVRVFMSANSTFATTHTVFFIHTTLPRYTTRTGDPIPESLLEGLEKSQARPVSADSNSSVRVCIPLCKSCSVIPPPHPPHPKA